MSGSGVTEDEIATTSSKTHVDSSRALLKWDIQNIGMVLPNEADIEIEDEQVEKIFFSTFQPLQSPVFTTSLNQTNTKKSEQKWYVELDIRCEDDGDDNGPHKTRYASIFLNSHSSGDDDFKNYPFRLFVSFYIVGENNLEFLKRSTGIMSTNFKTERCGWGFRKFVSLKRLWEFSKTHLVDNVLRVRVELTVFGSPVTESGIFECVSSLAWNKFVEDMRELLHSGKDADMIINCGDRKFLVHGAILKGRSIVFERMLKSGMSESENKLIEIKDVDPIVFEAFLEYIYTSKVELRAENLDKLFGLVRVADKYGISELKAICFKYICEHMSVENAGEIAVLSFEHNAGENLRSKIVGFCQMNWSRLAQLDTFKTYVLENPLAFFDDGAGKREKSNEH